MTKFLVSIATLFSLVAVSCKKDRTPKPNVDGFIADHGGTYIGRMHFLEYTFRDNHSDTLSYDSTDVIRVFKVSDDSIGIGTKAWLNGESHYRYYGNDNLKDEIYPNSSHEDRSVNFTSKDSISISFQNYIPIGVIYITFNGRKQ